jgi:hypothetical protein
MSLQLAEYLKRRSRRATTGILVAAACGLVLDGWNVIPAPEGPAPAPNPAVLRGATTIDLPFGDLWGDTVAEFRAVTGGWRTANGYSGYEPAGYSEVRAASTEESPAVFAPFLPLGDLHVLVSENAMALRGLVERQPGVELTGRAGGLLQYRLPRRGTQTGETR